MKKRHFSKYQILTRVCTILAILAFIALGFCLEVFL